MTYLEIMINDDDNNSSNHNNNNKNNNLDDSTNKNSIKNKRITMKIMQIEIKII